MKPIIPLPGEDLMELAIRCEAVYICPRLEGKRMGPLVAYAGKDNAGRNFVGDIYFNFRRIEVHLEVVMAFAEAAYQKLCDQGLIDSFDTVCGIPQGGRTFGQVFAFVAGKRFVYADKKPKPTEAGKKQEYTWDLSQFEFEPSERVAVAEDIFNNFQNTKDTLAQIEAAGAKVVLLVGALNRSPIHDTTYEGIPVIASIREAYPEWTQDHPEVVADIAAGNIELEVKKNWARLRAVMPQQVQTPQQQERHVGKISLALDGLSRQRALELTKQLCHWLRAVKLHDLLDTYGPSIIRDLKKAGAKVPWVDYKIHDTKDTVALRVRALVKNGAKIITVHASGGVPMMKAAVEATFDEHGVQVAEIYAITVLTSLDDDEIKRIYGEDRTREKIVHELALMAYEAGVRTVVCSAQEVKMLKESSDISGMRFTVPGTRSLGVELGQQKRSGTPAQTIADGADELVAGSQVTKADDPIDAFRSMASEIGEEMDD